MMNAPGFMCLTAACTSQMGANSVCPEGARDIGDSNVGEVLVGGLSCGIVHQNVQVTERRNGLIDQGLAPGRVTNVARQQQAAPPRLLHPPQRFVRVRLLVGQEGDRDACALAGIGDGDCAANA